MRVLHVDHQALFRAALRALLTATRPNVLVREAGNYDDAIAATDEPFDLILVDIDLPRDEGIPVIRDLRRKCGATPILVLSAETSAKNQSDAIETGASGFASKLEGPEQLERAMQSLLACIDHPPPQRPMPVAVAPKSATAIDALTIREREVFGLLISAMTARHIAAALQIGIKTVETHRERIFKKLGVHSVVELVRFAARHGLLTFPTVRFDEPADLDQPAMLATETAQPY